jgi:hypothetical protein
MSSIQPKNLKNQKLKSLKTQKSLSVDKGANDLETFFGAFLYPKEMNKVVPTSDKDRRLIMNLVYQTLYQYSNVNLITLIQKCEPFRKVLIAVSQMRDIVFKINFDEK